MCTYHNPYMCMDIHSHHDHAVSSYVRGHVPLGSLFTAPGCASLSTLPPGHTSTIMRASVNAGNRARDLPRGRNSSLPLRIVLSVCNDSVVDRPIH